MIRYYLITLLLIFSMIEVKAEIYALKGNELSVEFRTKDNRLHITDLSQNNKKWITERSILTDFLWKVSVIDAQNQERTFNSQMFKLYKGSSDENKLSFRWELPLGETKGYVNIYIELNKSTSLLDWSIDMNLPEGWYGSGVVFPILNISRDELDKVITPSGWGAEYTLDSIPNLKLDLIYPSSRATMQMVCLAQQKDVLYYATHDRDANLKTFSINIGNAVEVSSEVVASKEWTENKLFSIPWKVSIGLKNKGWEDAAVYWYRPFTFKTAWGEKTIEQKKLPQWLLNSDLWLHGGPTTKVEYDATKEAIDYFGKETSFHWYYWMHHDYDTHYPQYLPARDGFQNIVNMIKSSGSHIMPYINGRLWDTAGPLYREWGGADEVVLRKNLQPYIETYQPHRAPNAVVCPTSQKWKGIVFNNIKDIFNELHCDAIYVDQTASARPLPCYNEKHNHPIGGGDFWCHSNRDIFAHARTVLKKDQILCTEQNAECFIDVFDLFLMGNRPAGKKYAPIPLFPIVYSDRALTYGFFLTHHIDQSYRIKNALTLLWGAQLNGGRSTSIMQHNNPRWKANSEYLLKLTAFRKKQHDLFVGGRMLEEYTPTGDNPLLTIENWAAPSYAVRGAKWLSNGGKEVLLLINWDNNSREIILPNGEKKLLQAGECHRINL